MIDARGLSCPEPVIMIKKALASGEDSYEMMVDNRTSLENVTRFVEHHGYELSSTLKDEVYNLSIRKK